MPIFAEQLRQEMEPIVSLSAQELKNFPKGPVIVQVQNLEEAAKALDNENLDRIVNLSMPIGALEGNFSLEWTKKPHSAQLEPLPIEFKTNDPLSDFPRLYEAAYFTRATQARIFIEPKPGVLRAVRVAASLGLPVIVGWDRITRTKDIDPSLGEELQEVVDFVLHNPLVVAPVEPFHSIFASILHNQPASLWFVLEIHPLYWREASQLAQKPGKASAKAEHKAFGKLLMSFKACRNCFFAHLCAGVFQYPRGDYDCSQVRGLLQNIFAAAERMRADLANSQ